MEKTVLSCCGGDSIIANLMTKEEREETFTKEELQAIEKQDQPMLAI